MTSLRVVIVDDEVAAREGLRIRLGRELDVEIVGEAAHSRDVPGVLATANPDVLLLDIEMPGADGFAVLDRMRPDLAPLVIFVTAHDQHARRAFDARAFDYLLKPVSQERLHQALERARAQLALRRSGDLTERMKALFADAGAEGPGALLSPGATSRYPRRISVNRDGAILFVDVTAIDWIDAAGDTVLVHAGPANHRLRRSMGEMTALLDPALFARIHRSTIVNLERIVELQPYFHGEYVVVLRNGQKLKLSRGYRDAVSASLGLKEN